MGKLTAQVVRGLRAKGRYADGQGLCLDVRSAEHRYWVFRYMRDGRERYMSLGPADALSLVDARRLHTAARALLAKGIDPVDQRGEQRKVGAGKTAHRFAAVIEEYVQAHRVEWRGRRSEHHWRRSLEVHVLPHIGGVPVAQIGLDDVLRCLKPIWQSRPVTASIVRGRIEMVLDYARAHGWRSGENPARWRGNLKSLLAGVAQFHTIVHHAALPWQEMPEFMRGLTHSDAGMGALALAFVVLTACRSGEVRGARWDEIDLDQATWIIPAQRMKTGKPHRVPLSEAALDILRRLAELRSEALVFLSRRRGRPMAGNTLKDVLKKLGHGEATVHGFRSTFRDWAAETTGHPNHVVEMALAHSVGSAVEAAYRRGDLFEKRTALMADWAAYLAQPGATVPVVRP
jgi:integrase